MFTRAIVPMVLIRDTLDINDMAFGTQGCDQLRMNVRCTPFEIYWPTCCGHVVPFLLFWPYST